VVRVAKDRLLRLAEGLVDVVAPVALDGGLGVGDGLAALDVEAADRFQVAAAALDELRDHGDLLLRVDLLARPVEFAVALAVRVEVAPVGVAAAGVPLRRVGPAALVAQTAVLPDGAARVRRVGRRDGIGLPLRGVSGNNEVLGGSGLGPYQMSISKQQDP